MRRVPTRLTLIAHSIACAWTVACAPAPDPSTRDIVLSKAQDIDQDGIANDEDGDVDGDGVPNVLDEDIDGDGTNNVDDADIDGDGVNNVDDSSSLGSQGDPSESGYGQGAQGDIDGDGIANIDDDDDDGDGVLDGVVSNASDCNGDGIAEIGVSEDEDCDGFCIEPEGGLVTCDDGAEPGSGRPDSDGDELPDDLDADDDGDGVLDVDDDNPAGETPVPGGGEGEGEGEGPGCITETFTAEETLPPRILLVVDRSGSMADEADGFPGSKWDAARGVLSSVVTNLNDSAEFGLMLYPDGDESNGRCEEGVLNVDVEADNASNVVDQLDDADFPNGGTPTASTLGSAQQSLAALPAAGGARVVVLATDGGPNCNEDLDGDTCRCVSNQPGACEQDGGAVNCLDDVNTVAAAAALNGADFPVFVIGIPGSDAFFDVLNGLANAGGTAQAGATAYYDATDAAALEQALAEIAVRVGACRFDLPGAVDPASVEVSIGGDGIARDVGRANGWDLVDDNTVELFGVACAEAATSGATVTLNVCLSSGG